MSSSATLMGDSQQHAIVHTLAAAVPAKQAPYTAATVTTKQTPYTATACATRNNTKRENSKGNPDASGNGGAAAAAAASLPAKTPVVVMV